MPTPDLVIALAIDQDGREWQPSFRDTSATGALIELVPSGQDSKAWSEMVALHTIFYAHSVADLVASWTAELAAADPQAGLSQTMAADGSIILSYESPALREKGIRRFMGGSDGVYMVAYRVRPQKPMIRVLTRFRVPSWPARAWKQMNNSAPPVGAVIR